MKKNRVLSAVLVLMLLMASIVTGYAAETSETPVTYTEDEVLTNAIREAGYDFTEMTADEIASCVSASTRLTIDADGGAKLSLNHESNFSGEVQLKNMAYSQAGTRAVKLSFVAPDNGTTIDMSLFHNNTRLRVFTYDNPNDEIDGYVIGCSNASFSQYVVTPGTAYTVIAKKNVAGDKIDIYVKSDVDTNYVRVLTGQPILTNSSANNWPDVSKLTVVGDATNDYAIYKDITLYGVGYAETSILAGLINYDGVDFTQMTEDEIATYATTGTNAVVSKDNGLKLTVGDAKKNDGVSDLGYGELNLGLQHDMKEGDAVKFSFMPTTESNSVLVMTDFQGNSERVKIRTEVIGGKQVLVYHTGEDGSGSARGISTFEVAANKMYDVIAKKVDGQIEIYAKESTDSSYKLILSEQLVYSVGATANCYKLHITGAAGSTATFQGVTQYVSGGTKKEILGTATAVLHHVDFDETYDGVAGKDATSADGFAYSDTITKWSLPGNYIPDGGAMAVRFKTNNSPFQAWVSGEEGRSILMVDAAGKAKLKTRTDGNVQLDVATISQNTWHTFIVKDNGDGWDVYVAKDETGGFAKKLSSDVKEEAAGSGNIDLTGSTGTYVDYFTIYGPSAIDVPASDGLKLLHQVDFAANENALNDAKVITKRNATVENGVLSLTQTIEGDKTVAGGYFYDNSGIPAGGYAEYTVKGSSIIQKFFQDGHYMAVNNVAYGMDDLTHTFKYPIEENNWAAATNMTHTPNVKWVYRVARSEDGSTYSVWRKLDGTDGWTKVFEDITVRSGETAVKCGFEGVGEVDYIKIYAPVKDGLTLFDGDNTTMSVESTDDLKYKNELKAVVNLSEDAILMFAIYDADGCLRNLMTEPVTADTEMVTVKNVSAGDTVRVFLWDNLQDMNTL